MPKTSSFSPTVATAWASVAAAYTGRSTSPIRQQTPEQIIDTLLELSSRIAVVADRHIVADGSAAQVMANPHPFIKEFFLGERGRRLYGAKHFADLYAVFSTPTMLTVMHGPEAVGQIDAYFAHAEDLEHLTFTLAARMWRATHVDWPKAIIHVVPIEHAGLPRWQGQPILLGRDLCQSMLAILTSTDEPEHWSKRARQKMTELREQHAFLQPEGETLEQSPSGYRLWTFAGGKSNNLLAKTLQSILGAKITNNNIYVSFSEDAGKSEVAIRQALDNLRVARRPNGDDALQFAASCARGTLSKFEPCLPDRLLNEYLAERLTAISER